MNIVAAERGELARFVADNLGGVTKEVEWIWISVARIFRRPSERHHQRTRQGDLKRSLRTASRVAELLVGERSLPVNLLDHRVLNLNLGRFTRDAFLMRLTPGTLKRGNFLDSGDHVGQRRDEMGTPHFTIGDHIDAALLLQRDRLIHGVVFYALELARRHRAGKPCFARLFEILGSKHRSDHFRSIKGCCHGFPLRALFLSDHRANSD